MCSGKNFILMKFNSAASSEKFRNFQGISYSSPDLGKLQFRRPIDFQASYQLLGVPSTFRRPKNILGVPSTFRRPKNILGVPTIFGTSRLSTSRFKKIIFCCLKKAEEGFRRFLTPSNPFCSPSQQKKFDFQGSPLWFFIALKICLQITDKYNVCSKILKNNEVGKGKTSLLEIELHEILGNTQYKY